MRQFWDKMEDMKFLLMFSSKVPIENPLSFFAGLLIWGQKDSLTKDKIVESKV